MKFKLVKMSGPGWEKKFSTRSAARDELFKYICTQCSTEEGITANSKIEAMLATACGCEFDFEEQK